MLVNVLFASCMSVGGCSAVKASSVSCVNLSQCAFLSEDDMVVMSGDVGCWCSLFGTLVGVSVLSVMRLELESVSEISSPRWSSVYECQSVGCAFTSPVIIELGMLVMYCMQFVMSVSVVSVVSWCGVVGYGDVLEVFCVYFYKLYFCVVHVDSLWHLDVCEGCV